ncbi:MAG TPA: dephospho-CoA kinase [Dehalococcoidia bacterium]|nr:dephospho-CoA kinase [Dehalococcoidia bacterium]
MVTYFEYAGQDVAIGGEHLMYVVGLTGGIGTGKSVVVRVLEERGAAILDADRVGHEVYLPGRAAYEEIVAEFGDSVVAEDGTIDRKKLGPIVFSSPDKLARLNAITHPRMKEMMREKLADAERAGAKVVVLEAALLFDAGWDDLTDEVWVTVVDGETAARRASERSGIPVGDVLERIQKAQMANEERIRRANVVIDTSGTLEDTRRRTLEAWDQLERRLAVRGE